MLQSPQMPFYREKDFAMYVALLKIVLHFEGAWFQFNGLAATKKAVQQRAVTKAPWRRSFRNFSLLLPKLHVVLLDTKAFATQLFCFFPLTTVAVACT